MKTSMARVTSDVTALTAGAATLTLPLGPKGSSTASNGHAHWFVGVQFYTSAAGTVLATPTAGTIYFDLYTDALPDVAQRLDKSVNLASKNEQVDWAGPTRQVKLTIDSVAGGSATHFKVIAIAVKE